MATVAARSPVPGRDGHPGHVARLVMGDAVLATVRVATTRTERRRGLLGRDEVRDALVLPVRAVHTLGMHCDIDVAYCDAAGTVVRTETLPPGCLARPCWSARWVLECAAGTLASWGVVVGTRLELQR